VISKNALEAGGEEVFSTSLRDKLAGVVLYAMLQKVESSLDESVTALRDMIVSEFIDINKAVLQNSYKEGVSELEVLLRIIQQKHRIELAKSLKKSEADGLHALLARFRLFQIDGDNGMEVSEHVISGELSRSVRIAGANSKPLAPPTDRRSRAKSGMTREDHPLQDLARAAGGGRQTILPERT